MIQTGFESKVKIQQIINNQLPEFLLDENPKVADFLKQYYISQEYQSGPVDLSENLDQYLNVDNLVPEVLIDNSTTVGIITSGDTSITVSSTKGYPSEYGLLKIDDEIITYTGIADDNITFTGCKRGFSGITSYHSDSNQEELVFSSTSAAKHDSGSSIQNLSTLFLREFYSKLKSSFTPGLENVNLVNDLNVGNFIKEARSLYKTKGTDESFRILFKVLYGTTPRIVNLENYLIKPSGAEYVRREVAIAEIISGDPSKLVGQTIIKSTDSYTTASISSVEAFTRDNKQYFKLEFFIGYDESDTITGTFNVTPSSKSLEQVSVGSSIVSVDSTVGFAKTGMVISGINSITYTSKTINQFIGCGWTSPSGELSNIASGDNVRSDEIYFGYEDGDTSKKVEIRLTGVLSDFVQVSDTVRVTEGDTVFVKNIGDLIKNPDLKYPQKTYKEIFANSWIYNTSSTYEIESFYENLTLTFKSDIDKSSLKIGDRIEIIAGIGTTNSGQVVYPTGNEVPRVDFIDDKSVRLVGFSSSWIQDDLNYTLRRKLNKASSSVVPIEFGNNQIISDVQNVYTTTDDQYAYVASNSLPSSSGEVGVTTVYTQEITKDINVISTSDEASLTDVNTLGNYTSITFSIDVPFRTGDRVYYNSSNPLNGLVVGTYYVEVLSNNKSIKLYNSAIFIGTSSFATFTKPDIGFGNHEFVLYSQKSNKIGVQKIFKKFQLPANIENGKDEKTLAGGTGLLINGVEINNYKSLDKVYYGPLESIDVLNGGSNYDVINLPESTISAGVGTTALVRLAIGGEIKRVDVDTLDFDLEAVTSVKITGGNGTGAVAEPVIVKKSREVSFSGSLISEGGGVDQNTNQITFLTDHNFTNGQEVIYDANNNTGIGVGIGTSSLINNASYFIKVDNNSTIKLYPSSNDYINNTNIIGLSTFYTGGIHKFKTTNERKTLSAVNIINGGSGYTNRKLIVKPAGISSVYNQINFNNHGFNDGEKILYSSDETSITGLTTSTGITTTATHYQILKIDDNSFRLADAGVGGTITSNYETRYPVKFTTSGTGYQNFAYPNIEVSIEYTSVGFGTATQSYQTIIATPIVKGSILNAYVYEGGTGYGSTIINIERQPLVNIKNGREAQLKPIIVGGNINSVNIQFGGFEYYSIPDLNVIDSSGTGNGATLRPVLTDGRITDVKIINAGIGYSATSTSIKVTPSGSGVIFKPSIRSLSVNNNKKLGNEYFVETTTNHLQYTVNGYYDALRTSFEDYGNKVSKIIGWAYDGNPIYGPYGYTDPENDSSTPKRMISGYVENIVNVSDRPDGFDSGYFVEDFVYDNSGDLDDKNGRFAKTKDFPDGVYAYHALIDDTGNPVFPYFIGDTYRSNTLEENQTIDQSFDFDSVDILRNTFPYKVSDLYADNDFLIETNQITRQQGIIESVSAGSITDFNIINSGLNYAVNDKLEFDNDGTDGKGLTANVKKIGGKDIYDIQTSVETVEDSIFTWKDDKEIEIFTLPQTTLVNNDTIVVSGFSTNLTKLNNSYTVGIVTYHSTLLSTCRAGAATTEIYVSSFPPNVSVGNSIGIGTETLEILDIFENNNILRVRRLVSSITGLSEISHAESSNINLIPNSFTIRTNSIEEFDSKINNKRYFNARESVGIGTTTGVSIEKSFTFGDSTVTRSIPTKSIYIENHPFKNDQAVTLTIPASGDEIQISDTAIEPPWDMPLSGTTQTVYITNKTINTIGIRTALNGNDVFFRDTGSQLKDKDDFLLETQFLQKKGNFEKITSVVSISTVGLATPATGGTYHDLRIDDNISLVVKPDLTVGIGTSTGVRLTRDSNNENILTDPILIDASDINTTVNQITLKDHELNTGDKISYGGTLPISGLSTGDYFTYKVDDDKISLCETYKNSKTHPPTVVSFGSTGGSDQTISPVNPRIVSVNDNNLKFDLSDSSLIGYNLKIYYDQEFKNEFVSIGLTDQFAINNVGDVGYANASLTITYNSNLPSRLYYNLEKGGYLSTADTRVTNHSEILYINSTYNKDYDIVGIGETTFNIVLTEIPERLSYLKSECDSLKYSTTSKTAKGFIDDIRIVSSGSGYKDLPIFVGSASTIAKDAVIVPKIIPTSETIGHIKKVRILNEGFEYSSDKTLQPNAQISPLITVKDSNTIGIVTVDNGGSGYTIPPRLAVVDTNTRKEITNGFLEAKLTGESITSVDIAIPPQGLSETTSSIYATRNTNGVSIQTVDQVSDTEFVCKITTPAIGFATDVFLIGEEVWIEGIQKVGAAGSGFNSEDLGFNFFTVKDYKNSATAGSGVLQDQITVNVSGLTTDVGIAKTIQDSSGTIVRKVFYPSFSIVQEPSYFSDGEKIISDNIERDLTIQGYDKKGFIKIFGAYDLSIGEIIIGKDSGVTATVESIKKNNGRFKVSYANRKNIGWSNDVGKLDEDIQVIADNDYYQNLSYTVKSPITWEQLQSPVNSMVHTLGLKNFADTGISSTATVGIGSSCVTTVVRDVLEELRVDTIYDFDNALDIDTVGSESKFLKLKNKKLTDYILSKSNVVLKIDDLQPLFSDQGGAPFIYLNFYELDNITSYQNVLVKIQDIFLDEVQLVDLIILGDGTNNFLFEKGNVSNVGTALTNVITDRYGKYSLEIDQGAQYLRFTPIDSYDTDYDIKFIDHGFANASSGVGTTSIGFVDLIGFSGIVTSDVHGGSGITSSIVGVATEKYSSLHLSTQILDTITNEMNLVEIYMTHDGDDTYLTEYYFDSREFNSYSSNFIGTFSANIDSGNVYLNYTNDTSNDVRVKSRIIGFGATSVGVGTFRYLSSGQLPTYERSASYESNYDAMPSSNAFDVLTLDKSLFNAAKVTVECGMGKTRSLQNVLMVHDSTNVYVQQGGPTLSVNADTATRDESAGVGTFGGYFDGTNVVLKFYPDSDIWSPASHGKIVASSFSECFYTLQDNINSPLNLQYGDTTESVTLKQYNAINGTRIDRTEFEAQSNGVPIFGKTFNPTDSSVVNLSGGNFNVENHWFRTGEKLSYAPGSSYLGIGSTAMTYGIGHTLPSVVYAIREDDDNFKLATTRSNAFAGTSVSFGSSGSGNAHKLIMSKSNEKTLITVDNLVQYPLLYTPLVHTLSGNDGTISAASSVFALSGIGTLAPEDILRIDDEYMKINNVGLGTTNVGPITGVGNSTLVQVERGFVGSSAASHNDGVDVRRYKGSYNIVDTNIHFTAPPRGNPQLPLVDISNIPSAISDFTGRVFLRNDYSSNQIYDDISDQFTGIGRTFDLTVGGANTAGIGSTGGNGIVFINSIFQTPTTVNNPLNNYNLDDTGTTGVTSITFSGITSSTSYNDYSEGENFESLSDVNQNQLPRGGLIVSLGSSGGLGYAPLIGAKVLANINTSGAITGVVGVGTTLSPLSRSPLSISTASYNNTTGILSVTTTRDHGFVLGITNAVEMEGLHFACDSSHAGVTTTIFPDASNDYPFDITGITSANTFSANVGVSTIPHTYVGLGTVMSWYGDLSYGSGYNNVGSVSVGVTDRSYVHKFVSAKTNAITGSSGPWTPTNAAYNSDTGVLTLTIPSHGRSSGNVQIVQESLRFTCSRDDYRTYHDYPRPGDPAGGAVNLALTKIDNDTISVVVGAATSGSGASISAHPVGVNTHIFISGVTNGIRRLSGTPGDLSAKSGTSYDPSTGVLTIETTASHSLTAAISKNITGALYTATTGIMTVTSSSHGFSNGDYVKIAENSLTFTCDKDGNVSSHTYPRTTDPIYNQWVAIANKTTNTFEIQVGISTAGNYAHTYTGGTATNAVKKATGWVGIVTESLVFTCAQDSHTTNHEYPRTTDPFHWTGSKVLGVETIPDTDIFTVNVGKSPSGSGGALVFSVDSAGTNYKNPEIYVSEPTYSNLEVRGLSRLSGGSNVGTGLLVDVAVSGTSTSGTGSDAFNVSKYSIARNGYGFQKGDIIEPIGLVTHRNLQSPVESFQLSVDEVYSDSFGAWQFGEFDYIDNIKNYQDGARTRFPLYYNDDLLSFEAQEGTEVNLANALLIFLNGILQDPGVAYFFDGGTSFAFVKAPEIHDKVDIFFYRGTRNDDDTLVTDINETIKRGDIVQVLKNNSINGTISQDKRTVFDLSYSDKFETNLYGGVGVDIVNYKPLAWTKQKIDTRINGEIVYKTRDSIEPLIYPTTKIISDISTTDSDIFVEDVDLFGYNSTTNFGGLIVPGDNRVSAAISAVVSTAGTISSLDIVSGGFGYVGATTDLFISAPLGVGVGTIVRDEYAVAGVSTFATATATITNGTITNTTITNEGLGYSQSALPNVLITFPESSYELVTGINIIQGFSGIVTGLTTTTVGVSTLGFEFHLNKSGVSWTGIDTGFPVSIFDTTIGYGGTSIDRTGSDAAVVGIGSTFLDNIYVIDAWSSSGSNGLVTCLMQSNPPGIQTSLNNTQIGKFSWGRFGGVSRDSSPISIGVTGFTINSGLTTFPTIQRRAAGIRTTGALSKKVT